MQGGRIMVVEDEAIIAKEIEFTLKHLGYEVVGLASSGPDAVALAAESIPDLVLMDILLDGDMDGIQTAASIRSRRDVPVVLLTAFTDDETLNRVKVTEPHGYLVKPFNRTELRITIETALYKSEMDRRLRDSERRLANARKMEAIGALAGGIAHDFNNILSAIIGYSEMALARVPETDSIHKMLDRIHVSGLRARDLVLMLLNFSRPGASDRKPVPVAPIAREALQMIKGSLPAGVTVSARMPDSAPPVMGEPTQMHQVIMNLLTNAVDAVSEDGGVVELELDSLMVSRQAREQGRSQGHAPIPDGLSNGEHVRLTVTDDGPGMPPEVAERIFEPFFTTKAKGRGTGMGLAVVHGIANGYGGAVVLNSAPGRGASFTVYLPAAPEPGREDQAETMDAQTSPTGDRERILVVDDEKDLTEMIRDILSGLGYRVRTATDGPSAVRAVAAAPSDFDLVVTDQRMPGMDGAELAGSLAELRPDLPVILCTGYGGAMTSDDARDMGFKDIVRKPFDARDLARAVRRALDRERRTQPGSGR